MAEPRKDKELESITKGKEKVGTADHEDKSVSTNSSSSSEEAKKCVDAVDFFARQAKGIVIGEPKKSVTKRRKSKRKPATAGKRRKRAHGRMKRSISLRSGLSEIGMSFDSDSEPKNNDVIVKKELKGKGILQEETDDFQGSDTDSDEACKRMKKGRHENDDSDDSDDGSGAGTASGAHADLSSLQGLQVAGK